MEIKKFKCGLCKEKDRIWMTRLALRKHLSEDHRIMENKFNKTGIETKDKIRQNWIIEERCYNG